MKTKHPSSLSLCGSFVQKHSPDYFFCMLFMPLSVREHAFRLLAFYLEITRILTLSASRSVAGPMAGLIRLQWWRDILEGKQDRAHELAPYVLESVQDGFLKKEDLLILIEAREEELNGITDWDHWYLVLMQSAGQVQKMLAGLMGLENKEFLEKVAFIGIGCEIAYMAYGLPFLLKEGRCFLPQSFMDERQLYYNDGAIQGSERQLRSIQMILVKEALSFFQKGKKKNLSGRKKVIVNLPIIFAQRDIKRIERGSNIIFPQNRGIGDKLAVLQAYFFGRIKL